MQLGTVRLHALPNQLGFLHAGLGQGNGFVEQMVINGKSGSHGAAPASRKASFCITFGIKMRLSQKMELVDAAVPPAPAYIRVELLSVCRRRMVSLSNYWDAKAETQIAGWLSMPLAS
jgi:hypothetical protein